MAASIEIINNSPVGRHAIVLAVAGEDPVAPVPAMTEYALAALVALLLGGALWTLNRRREGLCPA